MLQTDNTTSLPEEILNEINRQSISVNELSRKVSFSYGTLRRILFSGRPISPFEFAEIARLIFNEDKTLELVNQFFPEEIKDDLLKMFSTVKKTTENLEGRLEVLSNEKTFQIANLIQIGYFSRKEEVHNMFGDTGLKVLVKMIQTKLIDLTPEGFISPSNEPITPSINIVKEEISNSIGYHKVENSGQGKNYAYFGSSLTSKSERKLLQQATNIHRELISSMLHTGQISDDFFEKFKSLSDKFNNRNKEEKKTEPLFYSLVMDDLLEL